MLSSPEERAIQEEVQLEHKLVKKISLMLFMILNYR